MSDDRTAITELKARYCRFLDTKDWDGWGALFTDDAVIDTTDSGGPVYSGREQIVASVKAALDAAKTVHHVHQPEIVIKGNEARAVWAMQDRVVWPQGRKLTGYGHYLEHYVREGGEWRIAESKLTRLLVEMDEG